MGKYDGLNPEQKRVAEANLKTAIEEYQRDLATLTGAAPPASNGGGTGTLEQKVDQEQADARLFDKLPPGEKTRLYLEDKPTWDRLKTAKENVDTREKLFNK